MTGPKEGALSFTPTARTTKLWSRLIGAAVIVAACLSAFILFQYDRGHYPALVAGHSDTGILNGYAKEKDGTHAIVVMLDSNKAAAQILSHAPVQHASQHDLGRTFRVYYTDTRLKTTFIDGIDQVAYTGWGYGAAGLVALIGLGLMVRPFKVKTKD